MTDYNSMKADEYAQRQGEMDEFDNAIEVAENECYSELPKWLQDNCDALRASYGGQLDDIIYEEARRRVMRAIKERSEP